MIFAHSSADHHSIDIAALGGLHHGADGVVGRIEIDIVGADDQKIGLLARRQRTDPGVEAGAMRARHRRTMQHVAHHQRLRRIRIAREPPVLRHRALQIERGAHLHEHVGRVGRLVIDAEPRLDAVIPGMLQRADAFAQCVLRVGAWTDVDVGAAIDENLPGALRQCAAMVEGVVGADQFGGCQRIEQLRHLRALEFGGDAQPELACEFPVGPIGT